MAKSLKTKITDILFDLENAVLNNNYRLPLKNIEMIAGDIIELVEKELKKREMIYFITILH